MTWIPDWASAAIIVVVCVLTAWASHRLIFRLLTRATRKLDLFWRSLLGRTQGPTRLAFIVIGLILAVWMAPLTRSEAQMVSHVLQVMLILLAAWIAQTALHIWVTLHLRRFNLDAEDNLLARKHATQSRVLLRVGDILIFILALSAALMTFDAVRQYGISLLASAGAAGIVLGLALQPVLKNLLAGIQIAVTQPIRLDDALLVEGEWGNVEEITSTYVVVRIWDLRRLILPLSYFIEHPFQNWTRKGADLLGSVIIYLDYRAPIDVVRDTVQKIAQESPLWDGNVAGTQVVDFREETMEVRILVSAANAGRAFDLRCEVREKLIAFLQEHHPYALPTRRLTGAISNKDFPPIVSGGG
jgi:small-conductance mechanosensitive channel